jgi:hypothetical protein
MQLLSRLLPSTLYLVVSCFIDNSLFILTVLFSTFSCSSVTTSHVFKQRNPSVGFLSLISSLIPIQTYLQTPCFVPKPSCLSNSTPEHLRSTPSGLALGASTKLRILLSTIYISSFITRCPSDPLLFPSGLLAKGLFCILPRSSRICPDLLRTSLDFDYPLS